MERDKLELISDQQCRQRGWKRLTSNSKLITGWSFQKRQNNFNFQTIVNGRNFRKFGTPVDNLTEFWVLPRPSFFMNVRVINFKIFLK